MDAIEMSCHNCGGKIAVPADALLVICKKCSAHYQITFKDGVLSATRILSQSRFTSDTARVQEAVQQTAHVADLQRATDKAEENLGNTLGMIPGCGCLVIVGMVVFGALSLRQLDDALAILGGVVILAVIVFGAVMAKKQKRVDKEREHRDKSIDQIRRQ